MFFRHIEVFTWESEKLTYQGGGGRFIAEVKLAEAGLQNQNGRTVPWHPLKKNFFFGHVS